MALQSEPMTSIFGTVLRPAHGNQRIADLDAFAVVDLYRSSGAVLFKGFNVTNAEFVQFSNLVLTTSSHPMRAPYEQEPLFRGQTIYDVDPNRSGGPRDLHSEASDTGTPLGACCFFCEQAPPSGGETTLGDGIEILTKLSPDTRSVFERSRIVYRFTFTKEGWEQFFGCNEPAKVEAMIAGVKGLEPKFTTNGGLTVSHNTCAILPTRYSGRNGFINAVAEYLRGMGTNTAQQAGEVTFDDGSAIPEPIAKDIVGVCHEVEQAIPWSNGDLVIVDNTRVLHGRRMWPPEYTRRVYAKFGELRY